MRKRGNRGRKDHYVPQGYLRGFIDPAREDLDKPLWVFDLKTKASSEKGTTEIGWERGFYDYSSAEVDAEHLDVTFAKFEREFPMVREHMEGRRYKGWLKQHRAFLLGYMQMMRARSPLFLQQQTSQNRNLRGATVTAVDGNKITVDSLELRPMPEPFIRNRTISEFFLILLLAFVMSLAGFFVESLTVERADRQGVLAASSGESSPQPKTVLGIRLADSFRSIRRSLHYITLFLGLVFLTYFLFEVLTGRSVHPAQYALVGIAQTIFYLLLLSLSEHLGFDLSFLLAGVATVALLSINTEWIFRSRALAFRALGSFTLLYVFVYILLRVEAYALLVGALASFAAVTVALYVTRNVDWYGNSAPIPNATPVTSASGATARDSWLK